MPEAHIVQKTSAEWAKFDFVLDKNSFGFDTTKKLLKLGDGVTRWRDLPTFGGGAPTEGGSGDGGSGSGLTRLNVFEAQPFSGAGIWTWTGPETATFGGFGADDQGNPVPAQAMVAGGTNGQFVFTPERGMLANVVVVIMAPPSFTGTFGQLVFIAPVPINGAANQILSIDPGLDISLTVSLMDDNDYDWSEPVSVACLYLPLLIDPA